MTYTLSYGIWNNAHDFTSRDVAEPTQHATEADAYAALEKERAFFRSIRYEIWWSKVEPTQEEKDI